MKREAAIPVSIAVVSLALLCSPLAQARTSATLQSNANASTPIAGQREANKMVPARASLLKQLDARKIKSGNQFQARLGDTIHLKNGPELPRGTLLIGTVVTDRMKTTGTSRLALRFDHARLKDGKTFPIKATIVAITAPTYDSYDDYATEDPSQLWNHSILQIDQINVLSGVDLHSKIASDDSGVFVSNKKDDVKLNSGSQIMLAIAAQNSSKQS